MDSHRATWRAPMIRTDHSMDSFLHPNGLPMSLFLDSGRSVVVDGGGKILLSSSVVVDTAVADGTQSCSTTTLTYTAVLLAQAPPIPVRQSCSMADLSQPWKMTLDVR